MVAMIGLDLTTNVIKSVDEERPKGSGKSSERRDRKYERRDCRKKVERISKLGKILITNKFTNN